MMTTRRPTDIQAELSDNREHIRQAFDALEHRLSGEAIAERARGYLAASQADEFVYNLGRSVRRNPVPVGLMGVGLSWLVLAGSEQTGRAINRNMPESNQGADSGRGVKPTLDEWRQRAKSATKNAKRNAESATESARQRAKSATQNAEQQANDSQARLGQAADRTQRSAERAARATRDSAARLADRANAMYQEQPLAVAAMGLVVGGIVAASLPRSASEDRAMGSASDGFVASARQTGEETAGQAQSVAESAADAAGDAAKSEAERQGIRGDPNRS